MSISGQGSGRLGTISIENGVGNLQFDGLRHSGFVYAYQSWDGIDPSEYKPIFISIAEDGSDLAVTYFYCRDKLLEGVYTESLMEPMAWEFPAFPGQRCEILPVPNSEDVQVDMPALSVRPDPFDTGITIVGDKISLGADGGVITFAQRNFVLIPFNTVDCSACPGSSFYELHVLLLRQGEGCFAVIYLDPDDQSFVSVDFGICLPGLQRGLWETYRERTTWSGSLRIRQ
jgi:hypothetical protein